MSSRSDRRIPVWPTSGSGPGRSRRSSPRAEFVRERLILFGLFGAVFTVLRIGILAVMEGASATTAITSLLHPNGHLESGLTAASFLAVGILARLVPAHDWALGALDLVGFVTISAMPGWVVCRSGEVADGNPAAFPILGFALVALWRSSIVPSPPAATLLVGVLAGFASQGPFLIDPPPSYPFAESLSFVVIIALVTMATSQVIYRLQRRARRMEQLGQYRLGGRLGGGGMGDVYRASHALMRRPVAIKILRSDAHDRSSVQRFEREVRLTATLEHPNTISIYDFGQTPEGQFYYVMELLRGLDLERVVQTFGAMPAERVIHMLRQAAGALGEAHAKGIIHRDVKPANMLLCELGGIHDFLKVLDFGLVKRLEGDGEPALTGDFGVIGTPLYLSPEAVHSRDQVNERSDVYSLGCVGYRLLTGENVFSGATVVDICHAHLHEAPIPPSQRIEGGVPADLEEILLQCLEKDPNRRVESMVKLERALGLCRDAGGWNELRAREWWTEHMPDRMPAEGANAAPPPDSESFHEEFGLTGEETNRIELPASN